MRIRIGYWKSQGDHVFTVKPGQSFRVRGRMLEMTGTTSKNSTVELKIETGSPQERDALVQLFPPPSGCRRLQ